MTRGETFTCFIESLAYGGDGIARVDGCVVFIPETVAGETVTARVTQVKSHFSRAETLAVSAPSPDRITPCCRVTDPETATLCRVPGCVYDHLEYAAEVAAKQRQLEGFFRRLKSGVEVLPPHPSPLPLHYRNKIVLHLQRGPGATRLGYRLEPSHRILDVAACPLACDAINRELVALRASGALDRLPDQGRITFRHTPHDGAVWWPDSEGPRPPCADLFTEASPAGDLNVPRDGFYQVNPPVGDALVRTASEWFSQDQDASEIVDLFCGVGVFGFACMKAGGSRLTGIESGRAAVAAAKLNARTLGIPGAFLCRELGRDGHGLSDLIRNPSRTTLLVDPPREGLTAGLAQALTASGTKRIIYISCDPATLTRDLVRILQGGYRALRVKLFDMFPRTAHFETLVQLERV